MEIPFPPVPTPAPSSGTPPRERRFDFVFTGGQTRYRKDVIEQLETRFKVASLRWEANELQRGKLYRDASFVLNIPQNPQWSWSSPMRILASLCYGRTIVSLQTQHGSAIDAFANHLPQEGMLDAMAALLDVGAEQSEHAIIANYNAAASAAERWIPLRGDFADWAIEEGLA